jgi:hypothetical protein
MSFNNDPRQPGWAAPPPPDGQPGPPPSNWQPNPSTGLYATARLSTDATAGLYTVSAARLPAARLLSSNPTTAGLRHASLYCATTTKIALAKNHRSHRADRGTGLW